MGRASKFSFPLPGRRSHTKDDRSSHRTSHLPPCPPRAEEPHTSYTKAERLLGTAGLPFRPSSKSQLSLPQSSAFMSAPATEANYERPSSLAVEGGDFSAPSRPGLSNRPSSNAIPHVYLDEGRNGSQASSIGRHLVPQTSNSTLRSYYDSQKSPLAVSQQTSNSAVRDMALRKGKPTIPTTHHDYEHVLRPSSRQTAEDMRKASRKDKPARLDLSKLFPKPRSNDINSSALLSPNKLVASPSALSTNSEFFPRPMTREPTPVQNARGRGNKLTKAKRQHEPPSQPAPRSASPVRLYERDTYDNAKINVRKPPRGIQHWFDGIDDETDEDQEDEPTPMAVPQPRYPDEPHLAPSREASWRAPPRIDTPQREAPQREARSRPKHDTYVHTVPYGSQHLDPLGQFSCQSQTSLVSNRTKDSAFSRSNLQDSSVLSISSSEDEEEDHTRRSNKAMSRDSLGSSYDHGDVVIGQAEAFDVRPPPVYRRASDSKMSMLTTSTTAATIEVMYSPEPPFTPHMFPKPPASNSRRSSHVRQPSVIFEDEGARPKTAGQRPRSPSPSARSARTSTSEPRSRTEGQRLMAVTEEEEALLEMMRKKRAAMARYNAKEAQRSGASKDGRQTTPPDKKSYRTSAFLANETPSHSPARAVTIRSRKSMISSPSMLEPPPRGRPTKSAHDLHAAMSGLQDSSSSDEAPHYRAAASDVEHIPAHQLTLPLDFHGSSLVDLFPSPGVTTSDYASVASVTTADHPSPLPSPITPGLRHGEVEVDVKVASSEHSCNGDNEDVAVLESGVIDPPTEGIKQGGSSRDSVSGHVRRRTASSGANVAFSPVRASFPSVPDINSATNPAERHDRAPVPEASSRPQSITIEPKIPRRSSKRKTGLTLNTSAAVARSRNSGLYSARTNSPATSAKTRCANKTVSRGNSVSSSMRDSFVGPSTRCSVSEDVLAAWSGLGGGRIQGM